MTETKSENQWREVPQESAKYGIILRPGSFDTSVVFYETKEDMEWAIQNSWFENKDIVCFKIMETIITIKE